MGRNEGMNETVRIINMTPHPVKVRGEDGKLTTFPPSGKVARVTLKEKKIGTLGKSITLFETDQSDIGELPEEERGVYYIVSAVTKHRGSILGRTDLLVPCKLKRNEHKIVIEAGGLTL